MWCDFVGVHLTFKSRVVEFPGNEYSNNNNYIIRSIQFDKTPYIAVETREMPYHPKKVY